MGAEPHEDNGVLEILISYKGARYGVGGGMEYGAAQDYGTRPILLATVKGLGSRGPDHYIPPPLAKRLAVYEKDYRIRRGNSEYRVNRSGKRSYRVVTEY